MTVIDQAYKHIAESLPIEVCRADIAESLPMSCLFLQPSQAHKHTAKTARGLWSQYRRKPPHTVLGAGFGKKPAVLGVATC